MSQIQNNKKLLKNTILLYARTLFTMLIALFTSRVVLQVLGVSDYGIYGVVASFVSTFSVVRTNLNVASNRFLSYELGKENGNVKNVFSTILTIHFFSAIVVTVILELVGCYYVFYWLNVPEGRLDAAFWTFQFSTLGFFVYLLTIPYTASIIANEKMDCFAFVGIFEAIMKLLICYLLVNVTSDKLIVYSGLYLFTLLIVTAIEIVYCLIRFPESRVLFIFNKNYIKSFGKFLGWNAIGSLSVMLREQGVSLLYNFYFGPVVNAAKSITTQIQQAISSFSGSFITALNPQITKLCVHRGARLSFYLMLFFSLPVIINIHEILNIWLVDVPDYTASFVRLSLVFFTLKSLQATLTVAILASGKVQKYNLYWGSLNLMIFPISMFLFYCGLNPNASFVVCIIITLLVQFFSFRIYKEIFHISYKDYYNKVIKMVVVTSFTATIIPVALHITLTDKIIYVFINILVSFCSVLISVLYIGMEKKEREKCILYVKSKIQRIK